jgi:hypothetical protein
MHKMGSPAFWSNGMILALGARIMPLDQKAVCGRCKKTIH